MWETTSVDTKLPPTDPIDLRADMGNILRNNRAGHAHPNGPLNGANRGRILGHEWTITEPWSSLNWMRTIAAKTFAKQKGNHKIQNAKVSFELLSVEMGYDDDDDEWCGIQANYCILIAHLLVGERNRKGQLVINDRPSPQASVCVCVHLWPPPFSLGPRRRRVVN